MLKLFPCLVAQVPMKQYKDCNFSYGGLKTQVKLAIESKNMYTISEDPQLYLFFPLGFSIFSQSHCNAILKMKYGVSMLLPFLLQGTLLPIFR